MKRTAMKPWKRKVGAGASARVDRACQQCGKQFRLRADRPGKACSDPCARLLRRKRVDRTCLSCGSSFQTRLSQFRFYKGAGKYCSQPCAYQGMVKDTAGKPIKDRYGRSGRKADIDWRKAVREKDACTCRRCGKVEKYIHTHHIAPRSRRPDLRHNVANGMCLCNSCHSYVHHHPIEATRLGLLSDETYELAQKETNASTRN